VAHFRPHPPQLLASDWRFAHAPPQHASPIGQGRPQAPQWAALVRVFAHAPPQQLSPVAQVRPHAPQWATSVWTFTQTPPQFIVPLPHTSTHDPFTHVWPAAHLRPHVPQLLTSVCRLAHEPPQFVSPVMQLDTHVPIEHTSPAAHRRPHVPQLLTSVCVFVQTPSQSVWPDATQTGTHAPSAHTSPEPHSVLLGRFVHFQPLADVHVLHTPAQASAQHRPPTHDPDSHSMPSAQVAPAPFFVQTPFVHTLPSPQGMSFALLTQLQLEAAVHVLHSLAQAPAQHLPPRQTFDRQSSFDTQSPPGPLGAATHRLVMQICPAGHVAAWASQAPVALHSQRWRTLLGSHVGVRHVVPAASRRQPPAPLQPLVHESNRQVPVGSAPPEGTGRHEPGEPVRLQDMQTPEQAVAQQRPCAQKPEAHSSARLHSAPVGRFPHEPLSHVLPGTHWASVAQ
jgi:hypothetical protein